MKIGILAQNREKNFTGINRATLGVLKELRKIDNDNQYYFIGKTDWFPLAYETIPLIPGNRLLLPLSYTLKSHPLDIVHCYSPFSPFHINRSNPVAKILTIHDLRPLVHPEFNTKNDIQLFDKYVRQCAEEADQIIAVSEYTKSETVECYHIPEERVKVIYHGIYDEEPEKSTDTVSSRIMDLSKTDYILSVSGIAKNKNQNGMIEAFLKFKESHPDNPVKFILTGRFRDSASIGDDIRRNPRYSKDIIFTGFVNDSELTLLYQNALVFIHAAYYEGFGLPILEALSKGKAVISSNTTSMPEVGGDAVEYCNPYENDSIVAALENVLLNDYRRKQLEELSVLQASKFSYVKAARETLDVYRQFRK